ncbi:MAG: NAD(+) synthase [Anaerolineales bacterium]|nr:NAD(+) synthase [Anaerolineales bacterium]
MKLALAPVNTTVGDLAGNIKRILDAAHKAKDADLIVFPEMVVPGYPPRDILYDSSFVEATELATQDLASQAIGLPPMLVGSFVRSGKKMLNHPALHNVAYLMQNGKMQLVQVKQLLPVYDVFYEPRWFIPGTKTLPPIEIAGKKVGILICEDMWDEQYSVHPGADLKAMGADLLVCMSASPYRKGGGEDRIQQAKRQGLQIAFTNLLGGNDELIFDGGGFMLNGAGELVAKAERFKEDVMILDTDKNTPIHSKHNTEAEVFEALVLGVRDFFHKNRQRQIVIGLSGGIDSSLAAMMAKEAVGSENITGIAIPSRFTDPRSTEAARELADKLGIKFEVIELESLHLAAEQALGPQRSADKGGENIQARLRMMILMSVVNQMGGMLLNTSNKTELSLGYSTLYGDMAGALSPLGDLTKPEVYALARRVELIPSFVMERAPSAELREGQVDPFDYETLSPQIEALVGADQADAAMRAAEHKRWQMGVVLKVNNRSFGSGRMMPITRK